MWHAVGCYDRGLGLRGAFASRRLRPAGGVTGAAHDMSRGPPADPAPTAVPTAARERTPPALRRRRCSGCGELLLPTQCWVREADGWWFHYQCHALAGTTGRARTLGW